MRIVSFFKKNLFLLLILVVAAFFRFYNFEKFIYFSVDEELLTATVRHMIWDRSPSFIVQNVALAFGLGPFYHYLLVPFYFFSNFNLIQVQIIPSILGVITTFLVYKSGEDILNKNLAVFSSTLYAASFLISLNDRRLVHLTMDPIMGALAIYAVVKIIRGDFLKGILIVLPIGFAFHADPSLIVLVIASISSLVIFRVRLNVKFLLSAAAGLFCFIVPFLIAEIRYKGVISNSIILSITRPFRGEHVSPSVFSYFTPREFVDILGRIIATEPSGFIEQQFQYVTTHSNPWFSPFPQLAILLLLICSLVFVYSNFLKHKLLLVPWIFLGSFCFGIFTFNFVFKGSFFQHYFTVIFPTICLVMGMGLVYLYEKLPRIVYIFLFLFLFLNFLTLLKSEVKYPLGDKIKLVRSIIKQLNGEQFSLRTKGSPWVDSAGWTELFTLNGNSPVSSTYYDYFDWIYRSYSLYPRKIDESLATKIVWIYDEGEVGDGREPTWTMSYKEMKVSIFSIEK